MMRLTESTFVIDLRSEHAIQSIRNKNTRAKLIVSIRA